MPHQLTLAIGSLFALCCVKFYWFFLSQTAFSDQIFLLSLIDCTRILYKTCFLFKLSIQIAYNKGINANGVVKYGLGNPFICLYLFINIYCGLFLEKIKTVF